MAEDKADIKAALKKILGEEADETVVDESTQKISGVEEKDKNTAPAATLKVKSGADKDADGVAVKVKMVKAEAQPMSVKKTAVKAEGSGCGPAAASIKTEEIEELDLSEEEIAELEALANDEELDLSEEEIEELEADDETDEIADEAEETDKLDQVEADTLAELETGLAEASSALIASSKDQIKAIIEGVSDLSVENKVKVGTLFEATLASAIQSASDAAKEKFKTIFEAASVKHYETLVEQVDTYLSYVAGEWLKENKLAVYHGTRQQIAENFIEELRTVFERHDLEIPESKANLLEKAVAHIEGLEAELESRINESANLSKEVSSTKKKLATESFTRGMVKTQAEKIQQFAEEVSFKDEGDFTNKLGIIVEHFFPTAGKKEVAGTLLEDVSGEKNDKTVIVEEGDSDVSAIVGAVRALAPKTNNAK